MRKPRVTEPNRIRRVKPTPVVVQRPHPAVWNEAMQRANGDARRIRIEDDETVVVFNHPIRDGRL